MDRDKIRAEIYLTLAELLGQPDEKLLRRLTEREASDFLTQGFTQLEYDLRLPDSLTADGLAALSLSQLAHWWREGIAPVTGKCNPVESLYKQWTQDKTCQMPFAREKGWLGSDWACHMRELLAGFQVELPDQFTACPDHLILELELMAILAEHGSKTQQRQFLSTHLDWLGDLSQKGIEQDIAKFYLAVFSCCRQYIEADQAMLEAN
jgi:TorA maturation chaperone TorD